MLGFSLLVILDAGFMLLFSYLSWMLGFSVMVILCCVSRSYHGLSVMAILDAGFLFHGGYSEFWVSLSI